MRKAMRAMRKAMRKAMRDERTGPTPTEVIRGIQVIRLAADRPDAEAEETEKMVALMLDMVPHLRLENLADRIVVALARPEIVDFGMRVGDVAQLIAARGWKSKADDPQHTVQVTLGRMRREGLVIHDPPLWRLAVQDTGFFRPRWRCES